MGTKLTVNVNTKTIEKAKLYARKKRTSVSRLIENYLDSITSNESEKSEITPLVKSLSGLLKASDIKNYKNEYADYLTKKYK